jgi:hypothetical protein
MSPSNLFRMGGLAAVGAGVLTIIGELVGLSVYFEDMAVAATTFSYALAFWLYMLGSVLLLGGLVAVYVYQCEEAGILGVVGFVVAFLGTALIVGANWAQVFIAPLLAVNAPQIFELGMPGGFLVAFITLGVGWLLFGIATLRAGVFPRWAAILLLVGAVLSFFPGTTVRYRPLCRRNLVGVNPPHGKKRRARRTAPAGEVSFRYFSLEREPSKAGRVIGVAAPLPLPR